MPAISPERTSEVEPTNPSRRGWLRLLWLLPLLAVIVVAGWVSTERSEEDTLLRQARSDLDAGRAERAEASLARLVRKPYLSREARWTGAELFFRLGEDHAANALLKGARPDPKDPRDRMLQGLAASCQRAALLLSQADRAKDPMARLDLARQALTETPEAPLVLRRVVEEELLVMSRREASGVAQQFEIDYLKLRQGTPKLAEDVKQRLAHSLGERTN